MLNTQQKQLVSKRSSPARIHNDSSDEIEDVSHTSKPQVSQSSSQYHEQSENTTNQVGTNAVQATKFFRSGHNKNGVIELNKDY